ncbi:MAG: ABC transporter permease [Candidatus Heimdallarchaeota archaeon]
MEKLYENLTKYEKKFSWKRRFGPIYRLYLSKLISTLFKQGKSWIFNVLILLPIIAGPIVAFSVNYMLANEFYSLYSDIMFRGYFGIIIPLFTMYIASTMFNDEKNNRSITYLTSRPIHRFELVIIKYLGYLTVVPLFIIVATLLNYLSFGVLAGLMYFNMALRFMFVAFIATVVYGAVFMLIGLLFKNPLWFGLFFVFIWEFVFASFSPTLRSLTISYYIKSLIVYPINEYGNSESPAVFPGNYADVFVKFGSPAKALTFSVVLLVVIIISIVLSWAILQGDRLRVPYKAGKRPGGWKYYLKEIRSYLITFGIIFLTVGLTLGPVVGMKKAYYSSTITNITILPNWSWYTPGTNTKPSVNDMGWGTMERFTVRKNDSLRFMPRYGYSSNKESFQAALVLCNESTFTKFFESCQNLWFLWAAQQYQAPYDSALFRQLILNYFNLAQEFLDDSIAKLIFSEVPIETFTSYDDLTTPSISYQASTKTTFYCVLLIIDYIAVPNAEFYGYDFGFVVDGTKTRIGSYVLGFVISAFGVGLIGLAIYSLATYSSKIEIERYEKKIAEFEEKNKNIAN